MTSLILRPASFNELAQFANMAAKSQMVPAGFRNKPEDIMLAVQMGSELGLAPMQALQNVAVINNRPSVWGDALIGICRASPLCEDIAERLEGEGDNMAAICTAKRRGATTVTVRFGVADAKKAGLWGKSGPWQQYPQRMLQMRARGFALRDAFPDLLKGLITAEEANDTPPAIPEAFTGPTIEARAEVVQPAPEAQPRPKWLAIADAFAAVVTAQDYYTILDREGQRIAWLKDNNADAFAVVDNARQAAAERMVDAPVDEAPAAPEPEEVP